MEKNKKLMVVIIALLVVLMAIVLGVSFMAYRMMNSAAEPATVQTVTEPEAVERTLMPLGTPMTINLLPDSDGTAHAINLTVHIAINTANENDAELIAEIQSSEAIIRDAVNYVICSKTIDEVVGNAAQDILKEEIITRLQDEFKTNIIYNVYFWDIYYL